MTEQELNIMKSQLDNVINTNYTLETLGISSEDFITDVKETLMQNINSACQVQLDNQ